MRNLKKVLTLVLTVAMVLSIMVVGTGAAFSDQDSIKNTEAVDMCVSLNIIAGMEDGSYRPANNVTRGQMCKMICVALNGGNEPTLGTNNTPTFSDVRTNPSESWAESFIESCYSQGIVSGVGSGRFNPGGSVTGTQAARMLLVTLGYRADQEGFTGDSWAVNVNTLASAKGLYKGLESIDANTAMTRDDAAQMIWNALNAYEIEYVSQLATENGTLVGKLVAQDRVVGDTNDKITLLRDKYEAHYAIGDMLSFSWNLTDNAFDYNIGGEIFQSPTDYSEFFGMNTKVTYTVDKKTQKVNVYGIVANDSKVLAEGVLNDIEYVDADYIEINGVKYRTDSYKFIDEDKDGNEIVTTGSAALPAIAQNASNYEEVTVDGKVTSELVYTVDKLFVRDPENTKNVTYIINKDLGIRDPDNDAPLYISSCAMRAIDENGNGRIDRIVYAPVYAAKVTAVGSKQITTNFAYDVSASKPTMYTGTYKFETNDIYDGVAKDDYVTITPGWSTAYDQNIIAKMDGTSGTVTGTRDTKVQIDGTWYENPTKINFRLGGTYDFANIGSFVFYANQKGSASLNDVLYVSNIAKNNLGEMQAKVYLYDGTSATVDIGTVYEVDSDTKVDLSLPANLTAIPHQFYTYTVKDGEYNLTKIGSSNDGKDENQLGYKMASMAGISKATNSIAGRASGTNKDGAVVAGFQDDAVVFISYDNNSKMKVVSGAVAKNYNEALTGNGQMLYEVSGGNNRVVVAYFNVTGGGDKLPSAKGESGLFAYVVSKPYKTTTADGTKVYAYEVWTGKGEDVITIFEEVGSTKVTKGSVISYTDLGDNMVEKVKANGDIANKYGDNPKAYVWAVGSIKNTDEGAIVIGAKTYLITDETTVLYVDTDKREGQTAGSIQTAGNDDKGNPIPNVSFIAKEPDSDSTNVEKLDVLVVDTNNEYHVADDLT